MTHRGHGRKSKRHNHYRRLGYKPGRLFSDIATCPICSTLSREKMCARLWMHVSKHLKNYAHALINEADDGILGIMVLTA